MDPYSYGYESAGLPVESTSVPIETAAAGVESTDSATPSISPAIEKKPTRKKPNQHKQSTTKAEKEAKKL